MRIIVKLSLTREEPAGVRSQVAQARVYPRVCSDLTG